VLAGVVLRSGLCSALQSV